MRIDCVCLSPNSDVTSPFPALYLWNSLHTRSGLRARIEREKEYRPTAYNLPPPGHSYCSPSVPTPPIVLGHPLSPANIPQAKPSSPKTKGKMFPSMWPFIATGGVGKGGPSGAIGPISSVNALTSISTSATIVGADSTGATITEGTIKTTGRSGLEATAVPSVSFNRRSSLSFSHLRALVRELYLALSVPPQRPLL